VAEDTGLGNPVILTEGVQKIDQGLELTGRGKVFVEIPHKGHPDTLFVHASRFAMGAALLFDPSRGHLDLAVAFAQCTVVDQKMIAQPLPEAAVVMRAIDEDRFSYVGRRVVNNDVLPSVAGIERNHVPHHPGIRDDKPLTDLDRVIQLDPVCRAYAVAWNIIHSGNAPESLERPHLVSEGPGRGEVDQALFDDFGSGAGG